MAKARGFTGAVDKGYTTIPLTNLKLSTGLSGAMLCMKLKKYRRISMRELNKDFKRCSHIKHKNNKYRRRLLEKAAKMIHVDYSSYFTNRIFCKLKGG